MRREQPPMKVIVTRPRDQAGPLAARIEALGHEVVTCPLIEIEPLDDAPVDTTGYDWLVVTSPNGAAELARRRTGTLPRVAAIGPGTAEALRAHGVEPELVAGDSRQEGLVNAFPPDPGRVLFAGAEGSRRHLIDALNADFRPLYRTILVRPETPPSGDLAVLASRSARRSSWRRRSSTCRSASTSRLSTPGWAGCAGRSCCATRKAGCTSAPTTACSSRPPRRAAESPSPMSWSTRSTRSSPCHGPSTAAI